MALHFLGLSMGQCYYSEWLNCATVKVKLSLGMPRRHLSEWSSIRDHGIELCGQIHAPAALLPGMG